MKVFIPFVIQTMSKKYTFGWMKGKFMLIIGSKIQKNAQPKILRNL